MEKVAKAQLDVMHIAEDLRETVKEFFDWEKEIKIKEQQLLKTKKMEDTILPPIRSHNIQTQQQNDKNVINQKNSTLIENHPPKNDIVNNKSSASATVVTATATTQQNLILKKAATSKDKGNQFVQLQKYDEAIYFYTDAINHYDSDPIFFTNRALCYLKLNKYEQCIEDCNKAIKINPKAIKAYYRRMLANISLDKFQLAIKDCETVLKLDPKNHEAQKQLSILNQKLKSTGHDIKLPAIVLKPEFSTPNKNMNEISSIIKSPHLRSKKPLKRIEVTETISLPRQNNQLLNKKWGSNENISEEVLDKLFNNNDVGNFVEIKRSPSLEDSSNTTNTNIKNDGVEKELHHEKVELITEIKTFDDDDDDIQEQQDNNNLISTTAEDVLVPQQDEETLKAPTSSTQFNATWNQLSGIKRFLYFKNIKIDKLVNLLGPCLEPDTITDIFNILKNYYMKENLEIIDILFELTKHEEFKILAMFLSNDDRDLLEDFIKYMRMRKNNLKIIESIEKAYFYQPNYD